MTRGLVRAAVLAAALLAGAGAGTRLGAQEPAAAAKPFPIGYVALTDDARYDEDYAYAQVPVRPLGRPLPGAEVGIDDADQIGKVIGVEFGLEVAEGASVDELAATLEGWLSQGVHFVIADLPAAELLQLADRFQDQDLVILNVTAPDDRLRAQDCRANLLHVYPSYSMLADAMAQLLVANRWRDILVLQGPLEGDRELVSALERSAQRFGARVVEVRPFVLTNDPRQREESNVRLMTADADYDVVFVADTDGEFARYVPYRSEAPRPVVGTAGLVASAWHWSWERHGAPQLNARFEAKAGRRMADGDWAAATAVKALVQSVLRSESTDFAPVRAFLIGEKMNLDGFKGNPMSVRAWDGQFRQPILLTTGNAVIARAPLTGFLHQTNELDTLGIDGPETQCRM